MENIEELVEETENVEQTTEEIETTEEIQEEAPVVEEPQEEMFTKSQLEDIVKKRLGRQESKLRKEYANKYGKLETVVNAGLGTDNMDDAVEKLTEFYTKRGINIPTEPQYSDRDLEVLANAEADDVISYGYDEIVSEVDRLANLGANMSQRDRLVFTKLANARKQMEEEKELAAMGVTDLDQEFKDFESKLNPNLTLKEKYDMYLAQKPKKENKIIGSMKGSPENKIKDYYSPEEIAKLTDEDLDDPQVWEAVRRSMTGKN